MYLLICLEGSVTERQEQRGRKNFHLLIHSPHSLSSWGIDAAEAELHPGVLTWVTGHKYLGHHLLSPEASVGNWSGSLE